MRYIFLVFGFVFFTMVFTAGLWADRTFALVVRDACIAAVVGGLAGQWFWNHVLDAMRITVAVKRAAADAAADKLSRETGLRVSRHAVLLAAVRSGLAKMLDVDITDFDDPIPGFGNVPEEAGPADLR